jgi:hypothetical protein
VERGGALALVLLLLLALQLLAHGSLVLARQELAASRASRRLVGARVAAEAGLGEGSRMTPPADLSTTALWQRRTVATGSLEGATFETRLVRADRERWLMEGWGRADGQAWEVGLGRLVWILDPVGRAAELQAIIEVGEGARVALPGGVPGGGMAPGPSPTPSCDPWAPALDSLFGGGTLPAVAQTPLATAGEPTLGMLGPAALSSRIPTAVHGTGTPLPTERLGLCLTADPWNWGDPDRGTRPCGSHRVVRWSPGSLQVSGGVGQGLLAVSGDLDLSGSRFHGVVLVGGHLTLRDGGEIAGTVRAAGGITVDPASRVSASGCAAVLAWQAARDVLGAPIPVPGGWIGPLDR